MNIDLKLPVPAKLILQGYDGMLRTISQISVDIAEQELVMPIIMAIQNKVRKYQRKDGDEAVLDWKQESDEVDTQILGVVSHISVHPDSAGTEGLTVGTLRRGFCNVYDSFSEPIRMYLARESIMNVLREKGFDGEVNLEPSEFDPNSGIIRLSVGDDEEKPAPKSPKTKKVH